MVGSSVLALQQEEAAQNEETRYCRVLPPHVPEYLLAVEKHM